MKGNSLPFFFAWVLVVTVLVGIGSFRQELVQLSSLFDGTVTPTGGKIAKTISSSADEISIVYNRASSNEPILSSSKSIKNLFREELVSNAVHVTFLAGDLSEAVEMSTVNTRAGSHEPNLSNSTSVNTVLHEELLRNHSVINFAKLGRSEKRRRSQLHLADVQMEFLSDAELFKMQLSLNYDANSSCKVINAQIMESCSGLGTQLGTMSERILKRMSRGEIFRNIDSFSCVWFENDKTKRCNTMFGDCYFPALTWGRAINHNGTCFDIKWFEQKYGQLAFFSVHFSWMSGDVVAETQPCVSLHIRRGDVCINTDRRCFDYDDYWRATKFFVDQYPELQQIVVVTDGDDFPVSKFQSLVNNVTFTGHVNRSKYNESFSVWAPEARNLGNSTSELLAELSEATKCTVLVGTLSAGISKWIFHIMLTRQGRLPLFYSLDGCLRTVSKGNDYSDGLCGERFL
jgi:hypothetical protein